MLYEVVRKILDVSKQEGKDIGVVVELLITTGEDADTFKNGLSKLRDYYVPITTFNRDGKEELIKELCSLIENNNKKEIENFLKNHEDYITESLKKNK